jgi:hypothetical protein
MCGYAVEEQASGRAVEEQAGGRGAGGQSRSRRAVQEQASGRGAGEQPPRINVFTMIAFIFTRAITVFGDHQSFSLVIAREK